MTKEDVDILKANQEFLDKHGNKLQGNIIKGHGRNHAALIWLRWENDDSLDDVKRFIADLARPSDNPSKIGITSADRQNVDTLAYRTSGDSRLFMSLYLTAEGLGWLGASGNKEGWGDIHTQLKLESEVGGVGNIVSPFGKEGPPYMLLFMAHTESDFLNNRVDYYKKLFIEEFGASVKEDHGQSYRNQLGYTVEHFGFADGISQPWFLEREVGRLQSLDKWNPVRNIKDFLVEETGTGEDSWGSFLIYRKMEQNVRGFYLAMENLAKTIDGNVEEAGAKLIGRYKDGCPLRFHRNGQDHDTNLMDHELHDFDFENIKDREKPTPTHAHIRKVNPRHNGNNNGQREPMILRRGITYGERELKATGELNFSNIDELPKSEVGLHFMSFQKEINTFNEILKRANRRNFNGKFEGRDPFLASYIEPIEFVLHHFGHNLIKLNMRGGFVKPMEGVNLYAPSMNLFETL